MRLRAVARRALFILAVVGMGFGCPSLAHAQQTAGVVIDAQGVVQTKFYTDPSGVLTRQRLQAAKAALGHDLAKYTDFRAVSLKHLEKVIAERNGALDETMRYLGGLLRIRYVFFYPESGDIVIAGPAEGWMTDPSGRVVGITTRRPVLQLQDLAVALRAFPPHARGATVIGCSIDPTAEGLAAMQQFLHSLPQQFSGPPNQAYADQIVEGLRGSLGLQRVTINGVSPKTNMARILVEADYRMKLIGIGLETPPVKLASFVQRANAASISRNALFRWYFVPDYQCVRVSQDGLAMELVGDGVKLVNEDELVTAGGGRKSVGHTNKASQEFASNFTRKYAELAERSPVYAELRNVIDLSVAAAFVQQQGWYAKAHWSLPVLGSEEAYAVELLNPPKMVESAVTAVWKGPRLTTPIGGGVHIEAQRALAAENRLSDDQGAVAQRRQDTKLNLAAGPWWWN